MQAILRPLTSCRARRLRQLGGALLAMVATLLVAASTTLAIRMAAQVGDRTERFVQTQSQMQRIRLALHAFAASHGRLPCPANGALDTGVAAPNAATTLCTARDGTVPWATLGLSPDDAMDAWGRKISYRVYDGAAGMTPLQGASMTDCDTVEAAPVAPVGPGFQCTAGHDVMPGPGVNAYLDPTHRPGLTVRVGAVNQNQMAWVLVSHGVSGHGAWLTGGNRMAIPASPDELANTQAPSTPPAATHVYVQREENVVNLDPASAPTHFDDLLMFERIDTLIRAAGRQARDWPDGGPPPPPPPPSVTPIVGAPAGINLNTSMLNSVTPVSYSGRDTNVANLNINAGADVGEVTISATGGNITRNGVPTGSAIGVCSSGCGNDNNSSMSGTEALSFKLQTKTAGKLAVGVLSVDPTVGITVTFRRNGIDLPGGVYVSPLVSASSGSIKVFANLAPTPAAQFDEVVVRPQGTSHLFIATIRFCASAEVCN